MNAPPRCQNSFCQGVKQHGVPGPSALAVERDGREVMLCTLCWTKSAEPAKRVFCTRFDVTVYEDYDKDGLDKLGTIMNQQTQQRQISQKAAMSQAVDSAIAAVKRARGDMAPDDQATADDIIDQMEAEKLAEPPPDGHQHLFFIPNPKTIN